MELKKVSKLKAPEIKSYKEFVDGELNSDIILKMNVMIKRLNEMNVLNNRVVTDWNKVMEWFLDGGLTDEVKTEATTVIQTLVDSGELEVKLNDELSLEVLQELENTNVQLTQTQKYQIQEDFVEFIKGFRSYSRMRFKKILETVPRYEVCLDDGKKHITYRFTKDINDDFWKIDECFAGELADAFFQKSDAFARTGTWVETAPNFYTAEMGATFKCEVKGEKLLLHHFADNRGGIWEFRINGGEPIQISTFRSTSVQTTTKIIEGLDSTITHKIEAVFKGADPNNPPSGGTARGWIYVNPNQSNLGTVVGMIDNNVKNDILLASYSNKEFAMQTSKNGISRWVPDHGVGVVSNISPTKFMLDNKEVNVGAIADANWIKCNDFKIIQHVNVFFSEVGNLAEMRFTHHVDTRGSIDYWGTLKALQTFTGGTIYPLMLAMNGSILNEAYTSIGNRVVNVGDESNYYLPEETNMLKSAVCLSANKPNYIAAGTILNQAKTMRIGKISKANKPMLFWHRASVPKFYWSSGENVSFAVGDIYSWSAKIAIAEIEDIYKFFTQ